MIPGRKVTISVTNNDGQFFELDNDAPVNTDPDAIRYWMYRLIGPDWDFIQWNHQLWQQHNARHGYDLNDDSHGCGGECNDYGCP